MKEYIKGKGILVGTFTESDIDEKADRKAVDKAMAETGLNYTNAELVYSKGKIAGLRVYVCTLEDSHYSQKIRSVSR